jgi:hypothetical protein
MPWYFARFVTPGFGILGQNIPIIIGWSFWEQGQGICIWFISFGVLALLATTQ